MTNKKDTMSELSMQSVFDNTVGKYPEQEKHPYISRNDYLKSLPQDEHGSPIVDKAEFSKLA